MLPRSRFKAKWTGAGLCLIALGKQKSAFYLGGAVSSNPSTRL